MKTTPLLVEHDTSEAPIGTVITSWQGPGGELRVQGQITSPRGQELVRSGKMRELSLGTSVHSELDGDVLFRSHDELSICERAARPGCIIDDINGRQVAQTSYFSSERARALSLDKRSLSPSRLNERVMTDASSQPSVPAAPPAEAANANSELVSKLSSEKGEFETKLAAANARLERYEQKEREKLASLEPCMQEFVNVAMQGAEPAVKADMALTQQFADNLRTAHHIESALAFAQTVHCYSANMKRKLETFSANADAADLLAKANAEIDELKAKRSADQNKMEELEALVKERTHAAERMQEELAKAGAVTTKFDFSKAEAREAGASSSSSSSSSAPAIAAASASASASPLAADPLLTFVSGASGSGRIAPSKTSHALLGSSSSSSSTDTNYADLLAVA